MSHKTEKLVIGVDGGGTKTACWIAAATPMKVVPCEGTSAKKGANNGEYPFDVLGEGHGGPSNPKAVGMEAACTAIGESIKAAFSSAQMPRDTVASCVVGLAGAADDEVQVSIRRWLDDRQIAKTISVLPDCELVLAAGSPDGNGIALIAGTGSLAFGRNGEGETARAGGWGYLLGDDGSGFAIAREAIRTLLTADDRGSLESRFDRSLLEYFQTSAPRDVVSAIYTATDPRAALAKVASLVLQLAEESDDTAGLIVESAGRDLATLVGAVAEQLRLDRPTLRLAVTGGVILGSLRLQNELLASLDLDNSKADLAFVPDPVAGAVRLALRCGVP